MVGSHVVCVAGLSGSGKSTAMAALEDVGFYCADNLPAPLIEQFLELCAKSSPPIEKIALALDARETRFLPALCALVGRLRESRPGFQLLFLDCSEVELRRRYRETRRVHPHSPAGSVEEGIARERELLAELAALADTSLDTTGLNVHELRATVTAAVSAEGRPTTLRLVSFGFRFGAPDALEGLFDARFLPNPYFEAELREGSGLAADVADYVLASDPGRDFLARLRDWLAYLLPLYEREGKAYVTIGVGCTGGRHRSVAVVEALARALRESGREVNVVHRDVEKGA